MYELVKCKTHQEDWGGEQGGSFLSSLSEIKQVFEKISYQLLCVLICVVAFETRGISEMRGDRDREGLFT